MMGDYWVSTSFFVLGAGAVTWIKRRTGFLAPVFIFAFFNYSCVWALVLVQQFAAGYDFQFSAMPVQDFSPVLNETIVAYSLLLGVAVFSTLGIRSGKREGVSIHEQLVMALTKGGRRLIMPAWGLLGVVITVQAIHLAAIDKSVLWSNDTYLLIKEPQTLVGLPLPIARVLQALLPWTGLLAIIIAALARRSGRRTLNLAAFLLTVYPLLFVLAQNSRRAPLYVVVYMIGVLLLEQRNRIRLFKLIGGSVLAVMFYLKVMINRGYYSEYQGIGTIWSGFMRIGTEMPSILDSTVGALMNIFQGALGFANAMLISPSYPLNYQVLSFSPLLSAFDGFSRVRELYLVKIRAMVPINAFGEVWHFHWLLLCVYLVVTYLWLRWSTIAWIRSGPLVSLFLTTFSTLVVVVGSQYPLRSSWRILLVVTVVSVFLGFGKRVMWGDRPILGFKSRLREGG